jgi:hypothetical protein
VEEAFMNEAAEDRDQVMAQWFENHYDCSVCGTAWIGEWSCACNDKCPACNTEIEPTSSVDLSRPLTAGHFAGAARIITGSPDANGSEVTAEEAKEYAEALLEGGEYRFRLARRC